MMLVTTVRVVMMINGTTDGDDMVIFPTSQRRGRQLPSRLNEKQKKQSNCSSPLAAIAEEPLPLCIPLSATAGLLFLRFFVQGCTAATSVDESPL